MTRKTLVLTLFVLVIYLFVMRAKRPIEADSEIVAEWPVHRGAQSTQVLDRRIAALSFDGVALYKAIDAIVDAAHVSVVVYWPSLASRGVTPSTPVTAHLTNVTLGQALAAILQTDNDEKPCFDAWDGIVTVAGPYYFTRPNQTEVYDLRDLLEAQVRYRRPHSAPSVEDYQRAITTLSHVLRDHVVEYPGDEWIQEVAGRFVVTARPDTHRKIRDLLRTRRNSARDGKDLGTPSAAEAQK